MINKACIYRNISFYVHCIIMLTLLIYRVCYINDGFFFYSHYLLFYQKLHFFDCCKEEGWDNKTSFCTVQFYYCLRVGNILICASLIFWLNLNITENFSDSNLKFYKKKLCIYCSFSYLQELDLLSVNIQINNNDQLYTTYSLIVGNPRPVTHMYTDCGPTHWISSRYMSNSCSIPIGSFTLSLLSRKSNQSHLCLCMYLSTMACFHNMVVIFIQYLKKVLSFTSSLANWE